MLKLIKVFSNIAHGDTIVTFSAKISIFHLIVSFPVWKMDIKQSNFVLSMVEFVLEKGKACCFHEFEILKLQ